MDPYCLNVISIDKAVFLTESKYLQICFDNDLRIY